jgi:hypothetical protein
MAVGKTTSTVTVNAAFLQEIKEVNADLWKLLSDVRHLCHDSHYVRSHRRRLVLMLGSLRDQLALHFALEEAYGYFDDPVFVAPQLNQKAESLRDEHQTLYSKICELADEVEKHYYAGRLVTVAAHVVQQFQAFDDLFRRHEDAENELILMAYEDDIGVGD